MAVVVKQEQAEPAWSFSCEQLADMLLLEASCEGTQRYRKLVSLQQLNMAKLGPEGLLLCYQNGIGDTLKVPCNERTSTDLLQALRAVLHGYLSSTFLPCGEHRWILFIWARVQSMSLDSDESGLRIQFEGAHTNWQVLTPIGGTTLASLFADLLDAYRAAKLGLPPTATKRPRVNE